ncbi:MAG: hypothetical protein ACI9G1_001603 [Pirellulaceae bacterium]|jgi:hypothetical protein
MFIVVTLAMPEKVESYWAHAGLLDSTVEIQQQQMTSINIQKITQPNNEQLKRGVLGELVG